MIKLKPIEYNSKYIEICKRIYEESFPAFERWDFNYLISNQKNALYTVYSILDYNNVIGIYVPWSFDLFIFIEYIAIDENCRGKNYGSVVLKDILNASDKTIVIEVEPEYVNDMAKKRIEWYKRFGFIMSDVEYFMPSLEDIKENIKIPKFIDMKIMATKEISKEEHNNIKNTLHKEVYKI